ncbi:hypothetical protein VNO80_20481 [Phaseolus coccineus]|uniref:Uncharacterized protein n=1 Tax=Phaseolus coccineus TaxID=3886 RepID=A0AAN9M647_PHACN
MQHHVLLGHMIKIQFEMLLLQFAGVLLPCCAMARSRNKRRWVDPTVPENISRRSRTPRTRIAQRETRGPGARLQATESVARVVVVGSRIRSVLERKKNWWDRVSERTYPMLKNCSHITLHRFPAKTNCAF